MSGSRNGLVPFQSDKAELDTNVQVVDYKMNEKDKYRTRE